VRRFETDTLRGYRARVWIGPHNTRILGRSVALKGIEEWLLSPKMAKRVSVQLRGARKDA